MNNYKNLGGTSGVIGYEIGNDSIVVYFKGNSAYLYNYSKPGRISVEQMKRLAIAGRGLGSYINSVVRKNYDKRIR